MDCMKRCSKCGEVKALDAFHRSKTGTAGRHAYCKECSSGYSRARNPEVYQRNREAVILRSLGWQRQNPERYRQRLKAWQEANRDKVMEAKRKDTKYRVDHLSDGYVAGCLGAPCSRLPKDLIELKREQLSLLRLSRQLKQELEKRNGN